MTELSDDEIDPAMEFENDNSPVLFVNQFLPVIEREAIQAETKESDAEISRSLDFLAKDVQQEVVPSVKTIGKCLRLIGGHFNRKYFFSDELRLKIVKVMLSVYRDKVNVLLSTRTRLLSTMQLVLPKHWSHLQDLTLDWQELWSELQDLVGREERYELRGSEGPLTAHANKLSSFLTSCRHYFTPFTATDDPSGVGSLVASAMNILGDLKQFHVVEGPLMLLCCLPSTAYKLPQIQALVPTWFDLWSAIDRNSVWDLCWIVILSRAVKYSAEQGGFDWSARIPFLLSKLRDLLKLPASEQTARSVGGSNGHSHAAGSFPRSFAVQYGLYVSGMKDPQETQIKKLIKLILQTIARDTELIVTAERLGITPPVMLSTTMEARQALGFSLPGFTETPSIGTVPTMLSKSTAQVIEFLIGLRPFVHSSNSGQYVGNIAAVTSCLLRGLSAMAGDKAYEVIYAAEDEKRVIVPVGTLRFLLGTCLTLLIEGMYTKNTMASRRFAMSLKHIVSLEPGIVHVLMPFFLAALEGKSVGHQPGHTMVALVAINAIARVALFPQPVLLMYIPELLRLLLPGVDAADSMKSAATLDLLSTLFSILPISFNWSPKVLALHSYLQLLDTDAPNLSELPVSVTDVAVKEQYEAFVAYVTTDWTTAILERIFILIEGQEQHVKGAKESSISAIVAYFLGFVFQAVNAAELRAEVNQTGPLNQYLDSVEKQVVEFATSSRPPTHTDKVCAKLLEQYLYCRPARLEHVLRVLLTGSEAGLKALAADKLAFRLRIIGGCLRQAHGQQCSLTEVTYSRLQALVVDKTILCHEESKAVRKAIMKLAKDFLKGCLSTYIIHIHPIYTNRSILGEPAVLRCSGGVEADITWYTPCAHEVKTGIYFVRKTLTNCIAELNVALDQALLLGQTDGNHHASTSTAGKMTIKQCEEVVTSQLGLLRRIVRGIAELIHDPQPASEKKGCQIPETGRLANLSMITGDDQAFLADLRTLLFNVLLTSNEKILHKQSPLRTSESVIKQWMKCSTVIVCRRVAFLKATEQAKKWITYLNAMGNTIFASSLAARCRRHTTAVESGAGLMSALQDQMYWKKHDWNTNTIAVSISLQRQTRGNQYSHATRRQLSDTDPVFQIAHKLLELTRHEYDAIRPSARKALETVLTGMNYEFNQDICRRLLASAGNENGSYYSTASALVLLKQSLFAKRIATDSDLKIAFLRTILPIYRCAGLIEEPDKREKLLLSLTDCMLKYMQTWSFTEVELKVVRSQVLPALLARVLDNDKIVSYGLRLDAILGYVVLHLISPSLLTADSSKERENAVGVMKYIKHHITASFGQPVHPIAIAALHRVVESSLHSSAAAAAGLVFDLSTESFLKLLQGLARVHPAANTDENNTQAQAQQWGRGLDQILQSSSFLQIVRSRKFTCRRHDSNAFSPVFRRDVSALLYGIFMTGYVPLLLVGSERLVAVLDMIVEPSKLAWGTSESEKRVANAQRAEMFAALLRYLLTLDDEEVSISALAEVTEAFFVAVEPLSVDYLRDWQEALHFAYETMSINRVGRVKGMIDRALSEFGRVLIELSTQADVINAGGGDEAGTSRGDGQGFSQQTKALLVVNALLQSTYIAASLDKTTTPIREQVLQLLLAAPTGVIAPFRALRTEFASLLSSLLDSLDMDERLIGLIESTMGESALTAIAMTEIQSTATTAAAAVQDAVDTSTAAADDPDVPTIAEVTKGTHRLSPSALRRKLISETACMLIPRLLLRLNLRSSEALLAMLVPALAAGIASPDNEVAEIGVDSLLLLYSKLRPSTDFMQGRGSSGEFASIPALQQLSSHVSWHVREAVIKATIALINSPLWSALTLPAKTVLKDLLAAGLKDERLAVQEIARLGMAAYLSLKSAKDLAAIAAAYTRNSESLADRERKRRRAAQGAGAAVIAGGNTDVVYANTIQMLSCIVLALPYDLPPALPPLLTSLLRHRHYATDSLKAVITSSVQSFRRSHVERWENDFKLRFTAEQLAELEGAGAAHYFA